MQYGTGNEKRKTSRHTVQLVDIWRGHGRPLRPCQVVPEKKGAIGGWSSIAPPTSDGREWLGNTLRVWSHIEHQCPMLWCRSQACCQSYHAGMLQMGEAETTIYGGNFKSRREREPFYTGE